MDSDFGSDVDYRKSMTGFLMSLNDGPISWKSSRQGGVTLSSSEAEFVADSQAGRSGLSSSSSPRFWISSSGSYGNLGR